MPEKHPDAFLVEVAYALPHEQAIIPIKVLPGTTAIQAVHQSGILNKFPQISVEHLELGIFGKVVRPETALRTLDRVEIYRPLIADAKEVRKQRAADGKQMKRGGGEVPTTDNPT